jgi:hypothetical protein
MCQFDVKTQTNLTNGQLCHHIASFCRESEKSRVISSENGRKS